MSLNHGGYPANIRELPDDPMARKLADFEDAFKAALKKAARDSGVEHYVTPIIDATDNGDGTVHVVTTVCTEKRICWADIEDIDAGILDVACEMGLFWVKVK